MSDISRLQDLIRKAAIGTGVPEKIKAPLKQAPPAKKMPATTAPAEILKKIIEQRRLRPAKPMTTATPAIEDKAAAIKKSTEFARQLSEALRYGAAVYGGDTRE